MPLSQSDELIACEQNDGLPKCNTEPLLCARDLPPASAHGRGALMIDYFNSSHLNATPSGSFSNHFSAASHICEDLDVVFVSDLLARVDVNDNSYGPFSASVGCAKAEAI
jgi:hypothetical protein